MEIAMTLDEKYMQQALKLAARGKGSVEPNPMVGCVIVRQGQVIGRGWHKQFGREHAEVNAIADCKRRSNTTTGATMYVSLEPCCHFGKTGPCTEAIIEAGIAKVVAAAADPLAHASGRGIERLRQAGIEVAVGVCEKQAKAINAAFFKHTISGRPWVILKWAQSIDGKLSYRDALPDRWISCEKSRRDAHKLRRRCQAILVGVNTVIADDPLLTPRPAKDSKILRVVLDSRLRIPLNCRLLATARKQPVLIVTATQGDKLSQDMAGQIEETGASILKVPPRNGRCDLAATLNYLGANGVQQLLVEGGAAILTSFLKESLADAVQVYIAPKILGNAGAAEITGAFEMYGGVRLEDVVIRNFDGDSCISGNILPPGVQSVS